MLPLAAHLACRLVFRTHQLNLFGEIIWTLKRLVYKSDCLSEPDAILIFLTALTWCFTSVPDWMTCMEISIAQNSVEQGSILLLYV